MTCSLSSLSSGGLLVESPAGLKYVSMCDARQMIITGPRLPIVTLPVGTPLLGISAFDLHRSFGTMPKTSGTPQTSVQTPGNTWRQLKIVVERKLVIGMPVSRIRRMPSAGAGSDAVGAAVAVAVPGLGPAVAASVGRGHGTTHDSERP